MSFKWLIGLAVANMINLLAGGAIFSAIEYPNENTSNTKYQESYDAFIGE